MMKKILSIPSIRLKAIVFILLFTIHTHSLNAHPPEFHQKVIKAGKTSTLAANPKVADEADRQIAYFQFEFLSAVALQCPTGIQPVVIQQSLAELHLATQSPQALPLQELLAKRASLHAQLRDLHTVIECNWSTAGLVVASETPPIGIARGLSRCVLLEVRNSDPVPADISVSVGQSKQNSVPWTVLPSRSQFFLTTLNADTPIARIELKAGNVSHELAVAIQQLEPARIRGKVLDRDANLPTAARVWVEGCDHQYRNAGPFELNRSFQEKPLLLSTVPRAYRVPFFYADGTFEIDVPPGPTVVTLERGFEHKLIKETLDLKPGEIRDVTLSSSRFVDLKKQGWISGDTLIHWVTNAWNVDLPIEDLAMVQRAEDLRVANNLTLLHRTNIDAFIKPSQAPMGPIERLCNSDYHIEMAEEYRNQNLYGHLCFLNLKWLVMPIGTGPQIAGDDSLDYPINKPAIIQAREQGAISIEAHGIGANHELPLNAIHSLTDSLDQIDPDDYYRLLDCGFQLPLTNGSDHPARIAGCARAYVKLDGDFSYEKWIDGIRRGRTFTTSGPLLFLTVNSKQVGDVVCVKKDESLVISVKAQSRFPIGRLQIISNGEVLKEIETDESEATIELNLPANESRWIVARCSRNDQWNAIWHPDIAHTSAIYVHVDSNPVFRENAAREWISRMRMHIRDIQTKGVFGNDGQRQEAIAYVDESIRRYERLIDRRTSIEKAPPSITEQADNLLMLAPFASSKLHELSASHSLMHATNVEELKKAVEPFVLCKVAIDARSRIRVTPCFKTEDLSKNRTHRFLVQVHNEGKVRDQLKIQVADQTRNTSNLGCEIGIVGNIFSTSQLTGDEFEWKLIELRWAEEGNYEIEANVGDEGGTSNSRFSMSFPPAGSR
jgi:hypothetical protein